MKTVKEMIAVMQAYDEGKQIEYYDSFSETWVLVKNPGWNWYAIDYRVYVDEVEKAWQVYCDAVSPNLRPKICPEDRIGFAAIIKAVREGVI